MASKSKNLEAHAGRPIVLSIVSVITFILGLAGTLSAIILGVAVLALPIAIDFSASFRDRCIFLTILWFVVGPLLILAGYNLWKMKKWAGQLAAIIYLFDLIAVFIFGIDIDYIFTGVINIIILVLITLSWGHLQPPSLFSHLPQEQTEGKKENAK